MSMSKLDDKTPVINNRKARHDFHIDKTYEAGIVLQGTEVKSIREGKARITEAFAYMDRGEVFIKDMHITEYRHGTYNNHEPNRVRKLLLNKLEIEKIDKAITQKGLTVVPLKLYFKHGRAKLEIGLARGKKAFDKRDSIAERESKRRLDRILKDNR